MAKERGERNCVEVQLHQLLCVMEVFLSVDVRVAPGVRPGDVDYLHDLLPFIIAYVPSISGNATKKARVDGGPLSGGTAIATYSANQ